MSAPGFFLALLPFCLIVSDLGSSYAFNSLAVG
jgi:hypothetical protein